MVKGIYVRLCQASAFSGDEGEEDYTIRLSSAACNSGSYHFLRYFSLRIVF